MKSKLVLTVAACVVICSAAHVRSQVDYSSPGAPPPKTPIEKEDYHAQMVSQKYSHEIMKQFPIRIIGVDSNHQFIREGITGMGPTRAHGHAVIELRFAGQVPPNAPKELDGVPVISDGNWPLAAVSHYR